MNIQGTTAVITGASSGIGLAYAEHFAQIGVNLILIARNTEKLRSVCNSLETRFLVKCEYYSIDLSIPMEIDEISKKLATRKIDILINNAGFGTMGNFSDCNIQSQIDMVNVHEISSISLTHAVLPGMIRRNIGIIINVSSIAPMTLAKENCTYSASKGFLIYFSRTLAKELKDTNIIVQALCPGFTKTNFHDTTYFDRYDKTKVPSFFWDTPEKVAAYSLKKLSKRKTVVIPGIKNRLLIMLKRSPFFSILKFILDK